MKAHRTLAGATKLLALMLAVGGATSPALAQVQPVVHRATPAMVAGQPGLVIFGANLSGATAELNNVLMQVVTTTSTSIQAVLPPSATAPGSYRLRVRVGRQSAADFEVTLPAVGPPGVPGPPGPAGPAGPAGAGGIGGAGVLGYLALWDDATHIKDSVVTQALGNIGVGVQLPDARVDIFAPAGNALDAVSETAVGVYGRSDATTSAIGVVGDAPLGTGVLGSGIVAGVEGRPLPNTSGVRTGSGVVGQSDDGDGVVGRSKNGRGVVGEVDGGTGSTVAYGVVGRCFGNAAAGCAGVLAKNETAASGYGVFGEHAGTSGAGVYGKATATTGLVYGVSGESTSSEGTGVVGVGGFAGVYGEAKAQTGPAYGLHGRSQSTEGTGVAGVGGQVGAFGQGGTHGVLGVVNGAAPCSTCPSGYYAAAVHGIANHVSAYAINGVNSAAGGTAVRGMGTGSGGIGIDAFGGPGGAAAVFYANQSGGDVLRGHGQRGTFVVRDDGSVSSTGTSEMATLNVGTLTKRSGAFKIDHPLEPANKYLQHSFVESPDMMNIYNGVVRLNQSGRATVELPRWFQALNTDFRYQLTCIGQHAPVYVAAEVEDNTFEIAGGTPGLRVSWQVTGIRQDAWARMNRIKVEEDKEEHAQGRYLAPEAHGQSPELAIREAGRAPAIGQNVQRR